MTEQPTHEQIMQQLTILIYNQPQVQQALTDITKAYRTRGDLTQAGLAMVRAVTEVGMQLSQNPDVMASAMAASPRSVSAAATHPGTYPAVSLSKGDTILHRQREHKVARVLASADEVIIELENGVRLELFPETQIQLVKPYEPDTQEHE